MQRQTLEFAVTRKDGIITGIGRSAMFRPKTNIKGGSVKWYEDKPKEKKG